MSIHLNSSLDNYLWDQSSPVGSASAAPIPSSQMASSVDPDSARRLGLDSAILSDPAKLYSQLERLSNENPATFQKITAQIGKQLQVAANKLMDSSQVSFIAGLAEAFENASRSGEFTDLFPEREVGHAAADTALTPAAQIRHETGFEVVARIFSDALDHLRRDSRFLASSAGS